MRFALGRNFLIDEKRVILQLGYVPLQPRKTFLVSVPRYEPKSLCYWLHRCLRSPSVDSLSELKLPKWSEFDEGVVDVDGLLGDVEVGEDGQRVRVVHPPEVVVVHQLQVPVKTFLLERRHHQKLIRLRSDFH